MTINYEDLLTKEQKVNILQQRLAQFAAEAWQHQLNKQTAESLGDTASVENADNAISIINAAIAVHQQKLDELNEE